MSGIKHSEKWELPCGHIIEIRCGSTKRGRTKERHYTDCSPECPHWGGDNPAHKSGRSRTEGGLAA